MTTTIEMPEYAWRAELIAKVMFTRRADINVVHAEARGAHHGWDLVVELLDGDAHTSQVFAVEVKATLKPDGFGHVAENGEVALHNEWIEKIARDAAKAADAPFPVCLIGFAMTTDTGFYAWIRRPVRDGSSAGLVTERPEHLVAFTDATVDEIVASVREWYRQRRQHAAAV